MRTNLAPIVWLSVATNFGGLLMYVHLDHPHSVSIQVVLTVGFVVAFGGFLMALIARSGSGPQC